MPNNAATAAARLSSAPMMDWTDRHCRYFHRQISRQALLYTEMVTAPALVRGGAVHLLDHNAAEHPVALQLGGSDPQELAEAARMGAAAGYDEINLNVGCPSDRVQSGTFGAVLMKTPDLVADCVRAMKAAVAVPVTVKCRIGVDDQNPEQVLPDFISRVQDAGCDYLIIHARKAWLQGLSPKENRDIPPLDYDLVLRMSERFGDLPMSINGGVETLDDAVDLIARGMTGVMIGRAAYHRPWDILSDVDARIFDMPPPVRTRVAVIDEMRPYIAAHLADGGKLHQITRHMLGLFSGQPGARMWRRVLSEQANRPGADVSLLDEALERMQQPDTVTG
ncbi:MULTISPECIES: tRNA dihydrouridine(20/20a) synthase DusA [Marivita]|uniref:tRNA-dihydrouridine(20/20a) synthase n=1 Tax=Marivita cryptomonadis TaxID=505252 RepID=A0A9Q2S636_9RHOB|nr:MULTISPECIES: tRNA dihydrouridine(20/20a) synthase DusA [Marivita]MCR9170593.1 tRNA dihydrouridine(20/20a) synthase DusA [Paracoccaceae bacterium]MBM2322804.1 tRNA dihydrouridine(20/20a) synthase DusA [Marivita cryptomonadis]MBM2332386.1 tRNA dihydrouridine(20/20a) synthase DusA [Marivita cryptomonadis]MBM2341970.1 tRNA dihydrouridine(20/20a) synthase DusA [Marivita cryptomonadis]MBM2346634.1 tRNA dihydrouridine(20/20a) synthase DusA [Marivita cryptomonadis]